MSTDTKTRVTTQVYEVYIKAAPQAIWDAITSPEWTVKYGYRGAIEFELRPGGAYRAHATADMKSFGLPDVVVDGVVEEADPPRKLVHTYRFLFSDANKAEGFTRVTWEIEKVTVWFLAADRRPRARGRTDHGRHGGEQVLRAGRGWLGLDSQRPEVAARDRELDVGPTSREGRSSHVGSSLGRHAAGAGWKSAAGGVSSRRFCDSSHACPSDVTPLRCAAGVAALREPGGEAAAQP